MQIPITRHTLLLAIAILLTFTFTLSVIVPFTLLMPALGWLGAALMFFEASTF